MRILYLTQWFEPEPNIIKGVDFVRALQREGHEVTVVTGIPNYPTGRFYPGYRLRLVQQEELQGIRVIRLPLYPSHDTSALRRSLTFLTFFVAVLAYCLFRAGRYDLAYVYHPPITVGFAAALAGCVRRLPYVLDVQDLWPDTVETTGFRGASIVASPLKFVCAFVYRRSVLIIAQSGGMRRALIDRGVAASAVTTVRNWAVNDAVACCRPERSADAPFSIIYAGNFGRAQDLSIVVAAAKILERRRQDIEIRLIGDGVEAADLRQLASGVAGVSVEPRVPASAVGELMAGADALILHLRDDPLFRITIPSKTQAYLAAGRPIVAGIAGEAAELLERSGAAIVVAPCDPQALSDAISEMADLPREGRDEMARAGRRFYLDELSFDAGMATTAELVGRAAAVAGAAIR